MGQMEKKTQINQLTKLGLNLHNAFQYHTAHPEVKKKAQPLLQSCIFPTHIQQKVAVAVTAWQCCWLTVLILFAAAIRPNLVASREIHPQLTHCGVDLVTGGNNAGHAVKMGTTASERKKKKYHTTCLMEGKKKKKTGWVFTGWRRFPSRIQEFLIASRRVPGDAGFLIKWVHLCMRYALHHPACIILETHDRF